MSRVRIWCVAAIYLWLGFIASRIERDLGPHSQLNLIALTLIEYGAVTRCGIFLADHVRMKAAAIGVAALTMSWIGMTVLILVLLGGCVLDEPQVTPSNYPPGRYEVVRRPLAHVEEIGRARPPEFRSDHIDVCCFAEVGVNRTQECFDSKRELFAVTTTVSTVSCYSASPFGDPVDVRIYSEVK